MRPIPLEPARLSNKMRRRILLASLIAATVATAGALYLCQVLA